MMQTLWRIEMLGWLRATNADRVVSRFRTQKTATLLAYLAYHRHRSHPREVLIELLWPESDPRAGRQSLRKALSSLRLQLEPPGIPAGVVLRADHAAVQLNPAAAATDVADFEASLQAAARAGNAAARAGWLAEAARLYGGELLPGFYADWIMPERQRLAEAYWQTLSELCALLAATEDLHGALQWARRAVAADPLREEAHAGLIRLLAAAGQPEAALCQYRELERRLAEELGATPSPEVRQLVLELQRRAGRPREQSQDEAPKWPQARARPLWEVAGTPPVVRGPASEAATSPLARDGPAGEPPPGRLPLQFTRFFGRSEEIARLKELLLPVERGLLTLTGPGGSGKTRLAVETARQLWEPFQQAVWFVPLLDLSDPAMIIDRVLETLRLPRSPQVEPLEQVVAFLSRRPSLLVLDNLEHLLTQGAERVQELRERVQTLCLLVTSRQRLGLPGEREFSVAPLPVPVDGSWLMVDGLAKPGSSGPSTMSHQLSTLAACPSVALFLDRAQAARAGFQLTQANAGAVVGLCLQLEGLPLALELAAARANVLTPQQMRERLSQRFDLLVTRQRETDPRHRSLRATLDWSYQLLSPELRQFFAQLSVFRGGWTLEAAEAVCGSTLPALAQLRECSLVQAAEVEGEMRFRLLETLREYGAEQLGPEEQAALAHRHASYYLALAERAEPELFRAEQAAWLDRLERERDNLRTALAWLEASRDNQAALQLAGALWRFWHLRGYHREGHEWLMRLLARDKGSPSGNRGGWVRRAKALNAAGLLAWYRGDHETTRRLAEESLSIGREMNDRRTILFSLTNLGFVAEGQGDFAAALPCFEESVAIARELGDPWSVADALINLGQLANHRWDVGAARPLLEESLRLFRDLGDPESIAVLLKDLADVARVRGDLGGARAFLEEGLAIRRELGNQRGIAIMLWRLARVVADQGDRQAARTLCEESVSVQRTLGDRRGVAFALTERARVALDEGDCQLARSFLAESLAISQELEYRVGRAGALNVLALTAHYQGDCGTARALAEEGLTLGRTARSLGVITASLDLLGLVSQQQGDYRAARTRYQESLAVRREQNHQLGIARTLSHLGEIALLQGDLSAARSLLEESLAIQREAGFKFAIPFALNNHGLLALYDGDLAAAKARFEEGLAIAREVLNPWAVAGSLNYLGMVACSNGDLEAAGSLLAESLALRRRLGARPGIAATLHALGDLLVRQGDLTGARSHYRESLSLRHTMGEKRGVAESLEGLAAVTGRQGLPERACRLFGAAAVLREAGGWPLTPVDRSEHECQVTAVRNALGETVFAAAWAKGQAMTYQQAVHEALQEAPAG